MLERINIPGPNKYGFWCQGGCGLGTICSDTTYHNGYCFEPELRSKALRKELNERSLRESIEISR